jgi:hypothetical protein
VATLILLSLTLLCVSRGQAQNPPQGQTTCDAPEHRQFDFWIGTWDVFDTQGRKVGENTIRSTMRGCVIHESWNGGGVLGESFNIFDRTRGMWQQTWVDSNGTLLLLAGRIEAGAMILKGETLGREGSTVAHRIRWSVVDGDTDQVRQVWEQSRDDGETWNTVFYGLYRRR